MKKELAALDKQFRVISLRNSQLGEYFYFTDVSLVRNDVLTGASF